MQNYKLSYLYSVGRIGPSLSGGMGQNWSAALLSSLFLTAADSPRGGVTFHLSVEEDVPIVLPNCNVVVPFKR